MARRYASMSYLTLASCIRQVSREAGCQPLHNLTDDGHHLGAPQTGGTGRISANDTDRSFTALPGPRRPSQRLRWLAEGADEGAAHSLGIAEAGYLGDP